MNGVCVQWKGRINLEKLDGIGCLEFDEERAMVRYIIILLTTLEFIENDIGTSFIYYGFGIFHVIYGG